MWICPSPDVDRSPNVPPASLAVCASAAAAYRHILRDGEPVLGQLPELQVAFLAELQVAQAAPHVPGLLPQLPVGLLQLLLPQKDAVYLLLPQSLVLPATPSRGCHKHSSQDHGTELVNFTPSTVKSTHDRQLKRVLNLQQAR